MLMVTKLLRSRPSVLALACTVLANATGCWVQSVYPFYEESDVVVDSKLVGGWAGDGELRNCGLNISLEPTTKIYTIALADLGGNRSQVHCNPNTLKGKLMQLGQQRFVDVVPKEDETWATLDLILKVDADTQKLTLTPLDAEWTAEALTAKNMKLAGRAQEDEGDVSLVPTVRVTLVSPTSDLRDFLRQHGTDRGAFSDTAQMRFRRK